MSLTLRLDATITVYDSTGQATDWLKPGTEAKATWSGVPSEQEVVLRYRDLNQMISVTLEDIIATARKRIDESRRGG